MRQLLVIVLAGILATLAAAQENAVVGSGPTAAPDAAAKPELPVFETLVASEVSLADFLWQKRPIVVFADSPADPRFQKQVALLMERPAALIERDVVLILDTDPSALSEIRKKLRPRGFMLTLIGKDGGIKLRKPSPWDVREITQAIDKWPLRKQEILEAKSRAAAER